MVNFKVVVICLALACSLAVSQGVRELFTEEELKTLSPQEVQKLYRQRLQAKRSQKGVAITPARPSSSVRPSSYPSTSAHKKGAIPQNSVRVNKSISRGLTKTDPTTLLKKGPAQEDVDVMTIDFVDTDIREVARTISIAYGYSIIIDNDVSVQVSIHLEDVGVVEGLSAICRANNLELIREGSIYRISNATEETIELLKMKRKKMDLDVQNQDIKKFIKTFTKKTGLNILAGKNLEGKITGSWKNQLPLEGFKALMAAHNYKVRKRNGFYIVSGGTEETTRGRNSNGGLPSPGGSRLEIDVVGDSVSVSLENADLADVLKTIAAESDINIVFFGNIRESINASLKRLPLAEAISMLLKGSKYTYLITEYGTLLVGSKDPKTPAGKILTSYEMYPLKHLKSENVTKILPKSISKTNITIIKEHNAILIMGTTSEIESVKKYLDIVDVPIPQVLLECVIVEYKRGNGEEFGLKPSRAGASDSIPGLYGMLDFAKDDNPINQNKVSLKDLGDASLGIGFLNSKFYYELMAKENDQKAKVLAMPKITTLNGNKASIKVTNTTFREVSSTNAQSGVVNNDYKAFNDGITLSITPFVTNGGQITLDISPQIKTSTGGSGSGTPDISTRSLETTVTLLNKQTIMLGGLIQSKKTISNDYLPFLGSIPVLGSLFSHKIEAEETTELVIYITPYIQNPEDFGVDLKKDLHNLEKRDGKVNFEKNIDLYRYGGQDTLELDTLQLKAIQDSLKAVEILEQQVQGPVSDSAVIHVDVPQTDSVTIP
ncbi:MAG: hypothetical protein OCC49_02500 [Fibrobacterales bacterium]